MNKETQHIHIDGNNNYQIITGNINNGTGCNNITINNAKKSEFSEYFDNLSLEYKCKAILYIEDLKKKEQQPQEHPKQKTLNEEKVDSCEDVPPAPALLELTENVLIEEV